RCEVTALIDSGATKVTAALPSASRVRHSMSETGSGADFASAQLFKVVYGPVCFEGRQIFRPIHPGADGDYLRADRTRASDVERGVTDNEHFFAIEFLAKDGFAPLFRNRGDFISLC